MYVEHLQKQISILRKAWGGPHEAPFRSGLGHAIVVLMLMGVVSEGAVAQHYLGIEGGYSRMWESQVERPPRPSSGYPFEGMEITGLSSGVVKATYYGVLSDVLGLHGAFGYSMIGSRNDFSYPFTDYIERRFHVLFGEAALAGQTRMRPIQLVARLGLRLGYAVDISEKLIYNDGASRLEVNPDSSTRRAYVSAVGAGGVAWNISTDVRMLIVGEYVHGLSSLIQEDVYAKDVSFDRYPHTISALIGIQFNI